MILPEVELMENFKPNIQETKWFDEPALLISAGGYEALLLPNIGGNLISLKYTPNSLEFMHTPQDINILRENSSIYGMPVLFPPNRIENGIFVAAGMEYHFPVNETRYNNHLHGFLHDAKWKIKKFELNLQSTMVGLEFKADSNGPQYKYFPHDFVIDLEYTLSEAGLLQKISVSNCGNSPMPLGIGFHTAFKVPFHPKGLANDYRFKISVDKEWVIDEKFLPTGQFVDNNNLLEQMRNTGISAQGCPILGYYTAKDINYDMNFFHGAIIEDCENNLRLIYRVDKAYQHWVLWNDTGNDGFVCLEPQTWMPNAPNVKHTDDVTGFKMLKSKEKWEATSEIYLETK
jgi:aldose 1-epimerase